MTRKQFLFIGIAAILLILLYLASSTNLLIKEKNEPVYDISVLVDSTTDDSWTNFKAGMEYAAGVYNADISFVLKDKDWYQNPAADRVTREVDNKARGLIISEEIPEDMSKMLAAVPVGVPVVTLGGSVESPRVRANFSPDWAEMGRDLADRILQEQPNETAVTIPILNERRENVNEMADALQTCLSQRGMTVKKIVIQPENIRTLVSGLAAAGDRVIVVFDVDLLDALLTAEDDQTKKVPVYGVGWDGMVRNGLESGIIRAEAVSSDYDAGFLAVQSLIKSISGKINSSEKYTISHLIVSGNDLFQESYEKVLFPIN